MKKSEKPGRVRAHDLIFEEMLSASAIQTRVTALGQQIARDYVHRRPVVLSVLNGSFIFTADLMRACPIDCEVSFVKVASYVGQHSSGKVRQLIGLDEQLRGRHVIISEDIVDSGFTMRWLMEEVRHMEPASVSLAVLLLKPEALQTEVAIDYLGFEIPNVFVIGYGLDYNGLGRNLPAIYQKCDE